VIVGAPDLTVVKTASTSLITANLPITYTITVTNSGNGSAANVTVVDHLPPGFNLLSSNPGIGSGTPGCTVPGSPSSGGSGDPQGGPSHFDVTCLLGTLAQGASATVTLVVNPTGNPGPVTNYAVVSTSTTESNTNNNTASVTGRIEGPDLKIFKTGSPNPVVAGNLITYTVTVRNVGTLDVFVGPGPGGVPPQIDPLVRDFIPNGTQFVSYSGTDWTCTPGTFNGQAILDCIHPGFNVGGQTGILKGGGETTPFGTLPVLTIVVVTANQPCPKIVTNRAVVDPDNERAEEDETTSSNEASVQTTVVCPDDRPGAILVVDKNSHQTSVSVPAPVTYTVTVRNAGQAPASGVTFTDTVRAGDSSGTVLQGVAVTQRTPNTVTCTISAGVVTCNVGTLAPGAQATVVIEAEVEGAVCSVFNQVDATGTNLPTVTDTLSIPVTPCPDLEVFKSVSHTTQQVLGSIVTFNITVRNSGDKPAGTFDIPVELIDELPAGLELMEIITNGSGFTCNTTGFPNGNAGLQGSGTNGGTDIFCTRTTPLGIGQQVVISIVVQLGKEGLESDCTWINFVEVDPRNRIGEKNEGNNEATATARGQCADLQLSKSVSPNPPFTPGQLITYTITLTNNGSVGATGITLIDIFDPDLAVGALQNGTYVPFGVNIIPPSAGTCTVTPDDGKGDLRDRLTCTLGGLQPNGGQILITVIGDLSPTPADCVLVNQLDAFIVSPEKNSDNAITTEHQINCVDLIISKSGVDDPQPNQDIVYTINVENPGTLTAGSPANPVIVIDHLDDNPQLALQSATFQVLSGSNVIRSGNCSSSSSAGHPDAAPLTGAFARTGPHTDVTCDLGTMPGGSTATITIRAKVPGDAGCAGLIDNIAQVDPSNAISEFSELNNVATHGPIPVDCPLVLPFKQVSFDDDSDPSTAPIVAGDFPFQSTDVPLRIPETPPDGTTGTTDSTVNVTGGGDVGKIAVAFRLEHQRPQDLVVSLVHPDNTTVTLVNHVPSAGLINVALEDLGGSVPNVQTACNVSGAPCTGLYEPASPLAPFVGKPANGTWRLVVEDTVTGNTGTLLNWTLIVRRTSAVQAAPGTLLTYTIGLVNVGNASFAPVSVVDHLDPAVTTIVNVSGGCVNPGAFTPGHAPGSGLPLAQHFDVTCSSPNALLPSQAVTLGTIQVITPTTSGALQNIVCLNASPVQQEEGAVPCTTVITQVDGAIGVDIAIEKLGATSVTAGGTITYTLRVSNGPSATGLFSGNIRVDDQIPATITSVIVTNNGDDEDTSFGCTVGTYDPVTGTLVSCTQVNLDSLADVDDIIVTGVVAANSPAACGSGISNTAIVDPLDAIFESDETNNSSTLAVTVECPDLQVVKTASTTTLDNSAAGAALLTYTVTITNNSAVPTGVDFSTNTNPLLVEHLPAGVTDVTTTTNSASLQCATVAGPNFPPDPVTGSHLDIVCTDNSTPALAAGESHTVTVVVSVPDTICGTGSSIILRNTATADPSNIQAETSENNNTAFADVTVACGDLDDREEGVGVVGQPTSTTPGIPPAFPPGVQQVTKTIILFNDGVGPINDVAITGTIGGTVDLTDPNTTGTITLNGPVSGSCSIDTNPSAPPTGTGFVCTGIDLAPSTSPGDNTPDAACPAGSGAVACIIITVTANFGVGGSLVIAPDAPTCPAGPTALPTPAGTLTPGTPATAVPTGTAVATGTPSTANCPNPDGTPLALPTNEYVAFTPTPSNTPTPTSTPTATNTPTNTPTPTATSTPPSTPPALLQAPGPAEDLNPIGGVTFSKQYTFTNVDAAVDPIPSLTFEIDIFQEAVGGDATDTFIPGGVTFPGIGPCAFQANPIGTTPDGVSNFTCTLQNLAVGVPQVVSIEVTSTDVEVGDALRFQIIQIAQPSGVYPAPTGLLEVVGGATVTPTTTTTPTATTTPGP
jgi:uncharacterized repeat protein (TIGR01451 family)